MKKIFISQPMNGKKDEEIIKAREKAVQAVKERLLQKNICGFDCINVLREDDGTEDTEDIQILNSFFEDYDPESGCIPLKYLAKSLEMLADADIAYFAKGWTDARGCRIEHMCALEYGINIMEERLKESKNMNEKVNLSSPWILFFREIEALFKEDPAVKVDYDEDAKTIKLYVEGAEKADSLAQLLPAERTFGNVTVKVAVIPANLGEPSKLQLFQKAFEGNPALAFIQGGSRGVFDFNYVVFKSKVVQFKSDDIGDVNGMTSTLYQDIAKDVFEDAPGIYFCTEIAE